MYMCNDVNFRLIVGKADTHGDYLPLWMHMEDTACVAEYLCEHRIAGSVISACGMEPSEFKKLCIFLALIHDIGKCTPLFMSKILKQIPAFCAVLNRAGIDIPDMSSFLYAGNSPHARTGEAILKDFECPDGICSIVGAHHGKPTCSTDITDQIKVYNYNYYADQRNVWNSMQRGILDHAIKRAGYDSISDLPVLSSGAQMLLCGFVIQADWIASNQNYFPLISSADETLCIYGSRAKRALEMLSLPDIWHGTTESNDICQLFQKNFGFSPNQMQYQAAKAACNMENGGLMIIEAQMGTGKTEAALAASEILCTKCGCGGVFFGLPTQATSNGIFPRLANWAEKLSTDSVHSVRLVHGMAELNEDYCSYSNCRVETDSDGDTGLTVHSWFTGNKQALLADFVVGTVDTALMAALKQKHVMLRHLGLCGKVVIIDECHAYDAYMSKYLDRLLTWLGTYKVPVILLSATLPQKRREKMLRAYTDNKKLTIEETDSYPLITYTLGNQATFMSASEQGNSQTVTLEKINDSEIAETLRSRLIGGGCTGIIVNTVKRAQMLSTALREALPDKKVYVYHAQFIAEDRIKREKDLIAMVGKMSTASERDNVIIVGTQVLEQSLDIDFDYLITDLCPMDLLLQRIGRLHRHNRKRPYSLSTPICSVLCSDGEYESGAEKIYGKWLLMQTLKNLPAFIHLPTDIPDLVNKVYSEPDAECDLPEWEKFKNRTDIKESRAKDWLMEKPPYSKRRAVDLTGMLDVFVEREKQAEAAVRDGLPSVDVIVMRTVDEDHAGFMPWLSNRIIRTDSVPSNEDGRMIAMQRLRLPFVFCCGERLDMVLNTLERENHIRLTAWQESPWLKGELVMLLDENGTREFCGYNIKYEQGSGLIYERRSDQ